MPMSGVTLVEMWILQLNKFSFLDIGKQVIPIFTKTYVNVL